LLQYLSRIVLQSIAFLLPVYLQATNYYLAYSGDDAAEGTSPAAAWKTIDRLNTFFPYLQPGDSILFRRGDTFYGSIIAKTSGNRQQPIVISAYGNGKAPLITGFTTIANWQPEKNGIWSAVVPQASPAVNLVVKDGTIQQVGRYPNASDANAGYLTYTAVSGPVQNNAIATITAAQSLTQNWTGAEVVIKKRRWNIERNIVTAQNGNSIEYKHPDEGNVYAGVPGFGFFFQRHPATLDQLGEWYVDPAEKKLLMYFGPISPYNSVVQISTINILLNIANNANFVISNIDFEGANEAAISSSYTSNCTTSFCNFKWMGKHAVLNWQTSEATVEYCTVQHALGSGIFIRNAGSGGYNNSIVRYCTVKNICQFAGMEIPGDASGRAGITVTGGNNVLVLYNVVDSAGYAGIEWQGNDVLVYGNVVSNCLNVRDDGGGIYSYVGKGPTPKQYRNRIVRKNIVVNCIGALAGTNEKKPKARGIYCDDGSNHILVDSNTIAYCGGAALYGNSNTDISFINNTVFGNETALSIQRFENAPPVRNITVMHNLFFPYTAAYSNAQTDWPDMSLVADLKAAFRIDSNYYMPAPTHPLTFTTMKTGGREYKNFTQPLSFWQHEAGFDKNSIPITATTDKLKFVYNPTRQPKNEVLNGRYKDVYGNIYNNNITLQPLSSAILIKVEK
jgi:hypothetical protein